MKRFWVASALLLSFFTLRVWAETPQQYDQALGRVQAALSGQAAAIRAQEVPTGEAPSLVAQQTLAPIHSVETPGQAPQPVETGRLIDALKAAEAVHDPDQRVAAFEAVDQQITALRGEIVLMGQTAPRRPDPLATVRSAREILAENEFASDPPPPPTLPERFAAWLDRMMARLNPPKTNTPNVNFPSVNPNVILGIFIVIAAAAFAVLVAVIVQALGRRGAKSKPLALDEEEATLVEARDNNSLLALAEQQAKAGDYRRAFRLVYIATLVALDSGGVLRFDRSKTNWEYLRALRAAGRGDVFEAMTPLTREFDQVWYGFARTDAVHYARALAQYQALLSAPQGQAAAQAVRTS